MLLRISLSCINFRNLFDMWVIADYFCIFVFLSGAGINRIRKPLSQSWNFSTSEGGWGAELLRGELHWVLHVISAFSFEKISKRQLFIRLLWIFACFILTIALVPKSCGSFSKATARLEWCRTFYTSVQSEAHSTRLFFFPTQTNNDKLSRQMSKEALLFFYDKTVSLLRWNSFVDV